MTGLLLHPLESSHEEFLRDESRRVGTANTISFPKTEDAIRAVLPAAAGAGQTVTVQGARTGITAGAVPAGGHILNLSRMKKITALRQDPHDGRFYVTVQPGVLLTELRDRLAELDFDTTGWSEQSLAALEKLKAAPGWFFPPDPTELSASLGGMVACNASGARSYRFGPTSKHVQSLRIVLADARVVVLSRGSTVAKGRLFSVVTTDGTVIDGELPDYHAPEVKNAAGYRVSESMDLVDLFIGMEGTLGVISEIEFALTPLPLVMWGVMCFLPSQSAALSFVRALRGESVEGADGILDVQPVAIEFFNNRVLDMLRLQKASNPAFADIPDLDLSYHTAVYVEFHGKDEDEVMGAVGGASEVMVALGGDEDATWLADSEKEMEKLKHFRHAVPEAVNLLIDDRRKSEPKLTKLGTDMSVPDDKLETVMQLYEEGLAVNDLESVVFGHIGNNHVHVNILPRSLEEYERGKKLYLSWAQAIVDMGGSVSAEHGIGKLKTPFLVLMYSEEVLRQMRALKKVFDPQGLLNKGNLFE